MNQLLIMMRSTGRVDCHLFSASPPQARPTGGKPSETAVIGGKSFQMGIPWSRHVLRPLACEPRVSHT